MSENKFKTAADIDAAVHLSSLLHQRYAEFTETLLPTLLKLFVFPKQEKEDEKTSRLVKQRMMLRFVTELILLGVYNDLGVVLQLLKDIVSTLALPLSLSLSLTQTHLYDLLFFHLTLTDSLGKGSLSCAHTGLLIREEVFRGADRN